MMRIALLNDLDLIHNTITHPAIYPGASDDISPDPADFQPRREAFYWGVWDDQYLGLFMGIPINGITLDFHVCMLPHAWGAKTKEAASLMKDWLREHTPVKKIVGMVGEPNTHALNFARAIGMEEYARLKGAWLKDGRYWDLVQLSMEV